MANRGNPKKTGVKVKRSDKNNFVQNLKEDLNNSSSVIVAHYAGLSVKEIDDLRNKLLDSSRDRLSKGSDPKSELLFMDIIKHLEHIGDYSLNISQALEQLD